MVVAFYFDHNVSRRIADGLRLRDVDVLTVYEDGRHRLDDPSLLDRASYFHDNSAKSLKDVLDQYNFMFEMNMGFPITDGNVKLTEQDMEDIIAFLELL